MKRTGEITEVLLTALPPFAALSPPLFPLSPLFPPLLPLLAGGAEAEGAGAGGAAAGGAGAAAAVAPVAAMRASRSAGVVHVMLVPAELTKGSAAQLKRVGIRTYATGSDEYDLHKGGTT